MQPETHTVLFVDDDHDVRAAARQTLELADIHVQSLDDPLQALEKIRDGGPNVVITDIRMPKMNGLEFLTKIQQIDPQLPVILVTGHGDVATAVKAMHKGAFDFIEKPFDPDHFTDVARKALSHRQLILENRRLKAELARSEKTRTSFIGRNASMEKLRTLIRSVADTDAHILIKGETGSGKEVIARAIHESSGRSRPFVAINCGAIPENLIESELFGYEAGAFTGASGKRVGKFEYAHKGTVFLDEIESMPLTIQVKLLRVLQERSLERLGSNKIIPIDLRVVAATKIDLREAAEHGGFREDLYYRLNVVQLHIPPLRHRKDDIPLLFHHFIKEASKRFSREAQDITSEELALLTSYDWPGNVRELRNVAERRVLGLDPLHMESQVSAEIVSLSRQVELFEKNIICEALRTHHGNVTETVAALDIPRKTFYDKLSKHGIIPADFRKNPNPVQN